MQHTITSDIIRSNPVFYSKMEGNWLVIESIEQYQKENGCFEFDIANLEQYLASGFVYGKGTVYKNVYALQAGEIITIEGDIITAQRYFEYKPAEKPMIYKSIADFSASLDKVFLSVFSRMLEEKQNVNRWIIPLSGGHDSRIIVNYLHRLGVKNVVCFSYGTPGNEQSRISQEVAEALRYPWHFIEYTEEKWLELHQNGLIKDYIRYAFKGVSTPHLQDFLAVFELKEKGILTEGDVFVPGHALDFITGGHFGQLDLHCNNKESAVKRTYLKHSRIQDYEKQPVRKIESIFDEAGTDPVHFQEYFNWQERQTKFIVNSIRAYEFFGFDTCLPFWDRELVDFWLKVPDEDRIGRKIFFEAEQNGLLIEALKNIPFAGAGKKPKKQDFEQAMKKMLPKTLIRFLLRITGKKTKLNEGLNQIYALKAKTVKELLDPVKDYPEAVRPYFSEFLNRYPYQMDYHFLTTLYTVRLILNQLKERNQK